ncbi:MAG: protein-L-isoaspartate O-methyltransferase [Candidatus Azambacteria bacterium]|nr:protein-L-isoaspartate O-methyltransferase [Candidatus Azambacteria bacterium]
MINENMTDVNSFVSSLINQGVLKTPRIIEAFEKIDRADFVPAELKKDAYVDRPLSIGEGQTISQPYTVAFMIELLQPKSGDKIFEVGFGSGWQTAILAEIVGGKGKIFAVERIEKLFEFGAKNISKYNFIKKGIVKTILADATRGLEKYAPFDGIIAAASGDKVLELWLKELKINGRLVIPIKESIWLYVKKSENKFDKQEFPGFVFVPLVSEKK